MVSTKLTLATLALAAATPALSTVVVTQPVATTSSQGGNNLTVAWNDDGQSPTSTDWGKINIYLATGSHDVQYKLQTLDTGVAYNKNSASYKIDKSVGPNGGYYFLRMEGTNNGASGIPPMSFSARFTLSGMTGTFNSTIMAQLSSAGGTASAGGGAASSTSSSMSSSSSSTGLARSTSSMSSATSSASAARSTSSGSSSDASRTKVTGLAGILVGLAAVGAAFM